MTGRMNHREPDLRNDRNDLGAHFTPGAAPPCFPRSDAMIKSMLFGRRAVSFAVWALACGVLPAAAQAGGEGNPNPGVLPPQSNAHGMSYAQWGDRWWLWNYSIPLPFNPVQDTTGAYAGVGQSGPVWFLAGTSGGNVVRTIVVPPGKSLFFPIVNNIWVNTP